MLKKLFIIHLLILLILNNTGFSLGIPQFSVPQSSVLYDINGKPIRGLAEQNRVSVGLEEISPFFLKAIIAVEDKHFYSHHGLDISGLIRAAFIDIKAGKIIEGGSTITQQTAKALFLSNERTWSRKIKELYYAIRLESKYSKDEILMMYCNTIYFGENAYGIEVAAHTFFGRKAIDLDLAQAALLAGIPRWPSNYDPYIHPDIAKQRQEVVLQRMVEDEIITAAEKEKATAEPLVYQHASFVSSDAPYFIDMARDYLRDKYGARMVYQGGLKVYTSLDLDMQQAANRAVLEGMKGKNKDLQVALAAMDVSNGHIRALVGGTDYSKSKYNRAFSYRQPGSTFKPFVYSLALDQGYNEADMIRCEEVEFNIPGSPPYRPTDYGNIPYHDQDFTLKEAIMISDNVVAVRLTDQLGVNPATSHAESFGFQKLSPVLSLPLGSNVVRPIDLTAGYSVFANQGIYNSPIFILKVVDSDGNILEQNETQQRRIVSAENAYMITDMLTGVMEPGGTGSHLKQTVGRPVAGKTGTTDGYVDAWFAGYTPQICCAVWVGFDQNKAVNMAGGTVAGPIWASFMGEASAKLTEKDFTKPSDIETENICLDSGLVATEYCPRQIRMAFLSNNKPEEICYWHLPNMEWSNTNGNNSDSQTTRQWWQLW